MPEEKTSIDRSFYLHSGIGFLTDDDVFLAHVDSSIFDQSADESLIEVQKIIQHVILMLESLKKGYSIERVLIVGGIEDDDYKRLDESVTTMQNDHSRILPTAVTVSITQFTVFLAKIEYHNLCLNLIQNELSIGEVIETTWISDLLIVSDRSVTPPIIAICQYVGTDKEMNGDKRAFDPTVVYMFDSMLHEPHVFILEARRSSPFIAQVIEKAKKKIKTDLPNRDYFQHLLNRVINVLITNIEQ